MPIAEIHMDSVLKETGFTMDQVTDFLTTVICCFSL